MNTPSELIPMEEACIILLRVARGTIPAIKHAGYHDVNRKYRLENGYTITIFQDHGEMDYLEEMTSPDGRAGNFESWMAEADTNPLYYVSDYNLARMLGWETR